MVSMTQKKQPHAKDDSNYGLDKTQAQEIAILWEVSNTQQNEHFYSPCTVVEQEVPGPEIAENETEDVKKRHFNIVFIGHVGKLIFFTIFFYAIELFQQITDVWKLEITFQCKFRVFCNTYDLTMYNVVFVNFFKLCYGSVPHVR